MIQEMAQKYAVETLGRDKILNQSVHYLCLRKTLLEFLAKGLGRLNQCEVKVVDQPTGHIPVGRSYFQNPLSDQMAFYNPQRIFRGGCANALKIIEGPRYLLLPSHFLARRRLHF